MAGLLPCQGGAPEAKLSHLLSPDRAPSPSLSPYSHDEGCLSSSQDHIPLAALPLLATSSPQYQEAIAAVIQRANLAYGDFIKSQEGMTFNGQVSGGAGEGQTSPTGWGGYPPSWAPASGAGTQPPEPLRLQVCLIGDCVGGILAFDALCQGNQPVSESQSSSRRGSVASVQVPCPLPPEWGHLQHQPASPTPPPGKGKEGRRLSAQVPRADGAGARGR